MATKDEFKKGCESGGANAGSFVENADGTYQCNTKSGVVIKCQADGQKCWIPAKLVGTIDVDLDVGPDRGESMFGIDVSPRIRVRL